MSTYTITGRVDGHEYGQYEGDSEREAVLAMLAEAGSTDDPIMDNWIVTPVSDDES